MTSGSRRWVGLAALLAIGAVLTYRLDRSALDWQPALAFTEPWRALSAVWVHYSGLHLAANLAGAALVAALGVTARLPNATTWAWAASWPLTQFGLLARPDLGHYGGLSGVLHAGAAVVAMHLLDTGPRSRRLVGAALLLGLVAKVLGESPWGPTLAHPPGWDIATVPFAHATGLAAGLLCAVLVTAWRRLARPTAALHAAAAGSGRQGRR